MKTTTETIHNRTRHGLAVAIDWHDDHAVLRPGTIGMCEGRNTKRLTLEVAEEMVGCGFLREFNRTEPCYILKESRFADELGGFGKEAP